MKPSFDLGKRIKSLLDEKGKSQSDLARYLRLRPSAISQWISGGTSPTYDRLEDVAHFFRMSVPEFLGEPAEQTAPSIIVTADSDDIAEIPAGSNVRVNIGTPADIGDIVLYKERTDSEFERLRFLRLAAYKDGISVLTADKNGFVPVIVTDSENCIVGPAVDIVLKRIKKETPSAGNTEDASKDEDMTP